MSLFNFFNKNISSSVTIDIHSHLIPSIDDGAKSMENSIELILSLHQMGYEKLITTPHISDMFNNDSASILKGYEAVKKELKKRNIKIELEVAAEYYANEHFEQLLEKREILTFGRENYLLFELSYFTEPKELRSLIQEIKLAGYTPVLAHPERYFYFHDSLKKYKQLKTMGVLFQINLTSIANRQSSIKKIVKQLILEGMVDFIGTDTHHERHLKTLAKSKKDALYFKIFKYNKILNDTLS